MNPFSNLGFWSLAVSAFLGTFISEDLTCITVGLLIAAGQGDLAAGLIGCALGIFVSDAALWVLGRLLGQRLLTRAWVRRVLPSDRMTRMQVWLDRNAGGAVLLARFMPGARLPFYLSAGLLGRKGVRLMCWTFLAAVVWTPLLVLSVAILGEEAAGPLRRVLGASGPAMVVGLMAFSTMRLLPRLTSRIGRAQLQARIARLWRWEFWPAWLFYAPLIPWYCWLAIRYRGPTVWTAANPGIPAGGVVGESKAELLASIPEKFKPPGVLVPPGTHAARLSMVHLALENGTLRFPLILKPDAAQRGAGVKLIHHLVDVEIYLQSNPLAILAQTYHPGPFEAGLFYCRFPGEEHGRLFSITDKKFPVVVGDGRSTLTELIWSHPRFRMQASVFLSRHSHHADRVLSEGEVMVLALAGNHCQGTMFCDGAHLITPELERAIDDLARRIPGFFVGRFDVRYTRAEELRAGTGFAIIELNGASSESTNLYDPGRTLWSAYRILYRQWSLLFRIGATNHRRGHKPMPWWELLRLIRSYYADRKIDSLAD